MSVQDVQADIAPVQAELEPPQLTRIKTELGRTGMRWSFGDQSLERCYQAEQQDGARLHNRITVAMLAIIFDAFIIPEFYETPELVLPSAVLRFGLLTPAVLLFLFLDWRGLAPRWTKPMVTALLTAPTLLACMLSLWVTGPTVLANFEVIPVMQLVVLTCRVSMRQALAINLCSSTVFVWMVLWAHFIPSTAAPTMVLIVLSICIGTLVFAWRLDQRDRQVFLFTRQAAFGQEMLAAQNRILAQLTRVDVLTGLGNRRCFNEAMSALWASAFIKPAAVTLILFDIDCFKQFNDALGHQAGDECLGAVARTVTRCLRDELDILVRYGGEEFAIILPDTSLEEGCVVAERVREAIVERALPHPSGGPLHVVTVSLGVATVLAPGQNSASLVEAADSMLYAAKRRGRNRVEGQQDNSGPSVFTKPDQTTFTPAAPARAAFG